jgi:aryl-phospho-beta-D-glucosidase BglC (GH1 family)
MKTYKLTTLFVVVLVLAACQPATPIPPTVTLTPKPPTSTPTYTPTPTITPTPTVGPGGFPRRFHVEGNAFVDQFSQKMIFRGMAMPDPISLALEHNPIQPDWNEHYYQVMASWGANIIRVPILPSSIRDYGIEKILTILDTTIAWAGENKMYVVIDFHSGGSIADNWYVDDPNQTTNMQEFLDFWNKISHRYANNDTVAFYELFNEPANSQQPATRAMWLAWKGVAEQAISVIRTNDPNKIILVGGMNYAYDLSYVADAPIAGENIGYATHPYAIQINAAHKDWDIAFGKLSDTYAVFATEFGYQDDKHGFENIMIGNKPYGQAIVDYLEERHISWMVWVFDDNWWTSLLLDENFRPSPSGAYFRSRLLELNFPGVPTTPLPTPLPTPTGKPGNLAYGKPVTVSSIQGSDYPAKNAVDGDPSTGWSSAYSDPQWIQMDLGAVYHIHKVVLNWETAYGVAYKIQISSDGANWETLYSTTTGIGGIEDLSVSGSGRYVRMYGTSQAVINGASYGYSLYEFEVYGAQ